MANPLNAGITAQQALLTAINQLIVQFLRAYAANNPQQNQRSLRGAAAAFVQQARTAGMTMQQVCDALGKTGLDIFAFVAAADALALDAVGADGTPVIKQPLPPLVQGFTFGVKQDGSGLVATATP